MATKKTSKKAASKKTASKTAASKASSKNAGKIGKKTTATTSKTSKTSAKKGKKASKVSSKRELIAPRGDKRYVRRDKSGQFTESDDQGRSLSADVRKKAKTTVKAGQGDKGDQK